VPADASTAAEHLGRLVVQLGRQSLSGPARTAASRALLDWWGVTLAGSKELPARVLTEALASAGGPVGLVGQDARADATVAALINGTASHTLELDDLYSPGLLHPGAPVIAAALALAEQVHASGEQLLRAICIGYEVGGRVAGDLGPGHYVHWHTTGTAGALAAAAAGAYLVGCDESASAHSIALAATMASGLQQTFRRGAVGKSLHAGTAAQSGVVAALSARGGLTGAIDALDGEVGLATAMSGGTTWQRSRAELGARLLVEETSVKPYPCCGHTFAPIDAALELVGAGLRPADVADIEVATYATAVTVAGIREPLTAAEARFSIPFAIATAITQGGVEMGSFTDRPDTTEPVLALMRRVRMTADDEFEREFPARRGARVDVTTRSGHRIQAVVRDRSGSPQNPLSDARVEEKFLRLAGAVGGAAYASRLLVGIRDLAALDDVARIHEWPTDPVRPTTMGARSR
jgi:2-methylcitrate dehydratase PrpD